MPRFLEEERQLLCGEVVLPGLLVLKERAPVDAGDKSNHQLASRGAGESEMFSSVEEQWKQGYWSWLSKLKTLREVVFATGV